MKRLLLLFCFFSFCMTVTAQEQSFGMIYFNAPQGDGWKKESGNNFISFSHVNSERKVWCQIIVYRETASKGNIEDDFKSEWKSLVAGQHRIFTAPKRSKPGQAGGWQVLTATAKAKFNRADMMILHTVMTGYNNCVSIVAKTNDAGYLPDIERFNASAGMDPATDLAVEQPVPGGVNAETGPAGAASNAVSYALTNWDDGWTSEAKEQWVKISKQDMQVLVHYPHQRADAYNSVLKDGLQNAWNILVAPRYTDIHNYELKPIQSYESIAFAEADGRDKISGRNVHIVLFKKHYSGGNGRYLEFITRDKISFEREFGVYHNDEFGWDKLSAMQFRNKFAVNNIDLAGKWSASDYASLSYYYVNSGGFAGATATSVSHEFSFGNDGTYQSDQAGASGVVGNQKFSRQVYKGRYTIKNWEMELTNRFQGGTEKYDCYFEAVSGGRILMLRDRNNTTYSLVKKQ